MVYTQNAFNRLLEHLDSVYLVLAVSMDSSLIIPTLFFCFSNIQPFETQQGSLVGLILWRWLFVALEN